MDSENTSVPKIIKSRFSTENAKKTSEEFEHRKISVPDFSLANVSNIESPCYVPLNIDLNSEERRLSTSQNFSINSSESKQNYNKISKTHDSLEIYRPNRKKCGYSNHSSLSKQISEITEDIQISGDEFVPRMSVIFPKNEKYQAITHEWIKDYNQDDDKYIKLLKESKDQADIKHVKGSLATIDHPSDMSATDMVKDGLLVLLSDTTDSDKEILEILTKYSQTMDMTYFTPENISQIEDQIMNKQKAMEKLNNTIQSLLKVVKRILTEKHHLKKSIDKLKKNADALQNEVDTHPTKYELTEMRGEIQEFRLKVKLLSNSYTKFEEQVHNFQKDINKEYEKCLRIGNNLEKSAYQLCIENIDMENFVDNFSKNILDVNAVLADNRERSQKSIGRLKELLNHYRFILGENRREICDLNNEIILQSDNINLIRRRTDELKKNLDSLKIKLKESELKYCNFSGLTRNLEKESSSLLRNITFIMDNLPKQNKLEMDRNDVIKSMQEMFNKLKNKKKDLLMIESSIKRLEYDIYSRRKNDISKIPEKSLKTESIEQDNRIWDAKMNRMFDLFEEMETLKEDIRADVADNMYERKEFLKQFDYTEVQGVTTQEELEFAKRFISSKLTDAGVCTKSGMDSATKADIVRKVDLMENKELRDDIKSFMGLGFLDMKSIPESKEQLSGIYGKFATSDMLNFQL